MGTFGAAFVSNIYMLLGTYEPQDDMEMSSQPQIATMYYWSYMIITFFILLNALLAIIVDSYASVKNASEQQADVDPLSNTVNNWIRNMSMPDLADTFISDKYLFRITQDLFDNISADKNANHPGMNVVVQKPSVNRRTGAVRYSAIENTTSENGHFANVTPTSVRSARISQVRLPGEVADRILHGNVESMKTLTRFYMMNRGTLDKPQPALIDQVSLVLILKTVAPTMHMKLCLAISVNILLRYGHNADLNGDGVISPTEWEALEAVMDGLDGQSFNNPTATAQKTRLINLMVM